MSRPGVELRALFPDAHWAGGLATHFGITPGSRLGLYSVAASRLDSGMGREFEWSVRVVRSSDGVEWFEIERRVVRSDI